MISPSQACIIIALTTVPMLNVVLSPLSARQWVIILLMRLYSLLESQNIITTHYKKLTWRKVRSTCIWNEKMLVLTSYNRLHSFVKFNLNNLHKQAIYLLKPCHNEMCRVFCHRSYIIIIMMIITATQAFRGWSENISFTISENMQVFSDILKARGINVCKDKSHKRHYRA